MLDRAIGQILPLLPPELQAAVQALPEQTQRELEELRLRCGEDATALIAGKERPISSGKPLIVGRRELEHLLNTATEYSVYAKTDAIRQGFLPLRGGHRLGLCGTAVLDGGEVTTLREISSVNLRVARQFRGSADAVYSELEGTGGSCLIIGPPGSGKTTLLRDLVRQLSDRGGFCVGLVDSRGELAACRDGCPQLCVGKHTDVISLCPKEQGIELLLRAMRPDWIAVDEITTAGDVEAISRASYCGAHLIATAHAFSPGDLRRRPVYRNLLELGQFTVFVCLDAQKHLRMERTEELC